MGRKGKPFDENAFWDRLKETQKEAIKRYRQEKNNAKARGEPWPELDIPKHWINPTRKIKAKEVIENEIQETQTGIQ